MTNPVIRKLDDLKERFERLSTRERVMVAGLGGVFLLLVIVGLAAWIGSTTGEIEQEIFDTRKALRDIRRYRGRYAKNQARERELSRLIAADALELNSYVDRAAAAVGVKVGESTAIKPIEGKRYERRGLSIKLRKMNIAQLVAFMKRLADSPGQLVQITRLSVNTRWNKHEELDVEMEVSTYVKLRKRSRSKRRTGRTAG
jgi:type II secretory pathway component PulM